MLNKAWVRDFTEKVAASREIRYDGLRLDAGETALFQRQLTHFIKELFNTEFPAHRSTTFFPVDTSAHPGTKEVAHHQYTKFGRAKTIVNYGDDLAKVTVQGAEHLTPVIGIGAAYDISIQDIRSALMAGVPLEPMLAEAAQFAISLAIDEISAVGDADAGLLGFLNHSDVPLVTPDNAPWSGATTDQIIADVRKLWVSIPAATLQIHNPDTLLFDTTSWSYLSQRVDDTNISVMEYLVKNLEGLKNIDKWWRLDEAGAASTTRLLAYERSPRTGRIILPQPFEQFAPQPRNLTYEVPCHARVGGCKMPYPLAYAYMDGTGA